MFHSTQPQNSKIFEDYQKDFSKIAEMVHGITEEETKLGCSMIAEEQESYEIKHIYINRDGVHG